MENSGKITNQIIDAASSNKKTKPKQNQKLVATLKKLVYYTVMKNIKIIIVALFVCASFSANVFSQGSPEELKKRALGQAELAKEFTKRAKAVVTPNSKKDDFIIARYLYTEAGKLFQIARQNFMTLEKHYYIGKEYSQSAAQSVAICRKSIGLCSQKIVKMT